MYHHESWMYHGECTSKGCRLKLCWRPTARVAWWGRGVVAHGWPGGASPFVAGDGWGTTTERHHWRMSTGPQPSITAATNCLKDEDLIESVGEATCASKEEFYKKIWMILATMPRSFILHNVQNLCMKTMQPHMYNIVWYHVRGVTDMYFKWCLGVPRCACVKSSLAGGTCSSGFDPILFNINLV